jgi:hypothetical protein
MKLYEIAKELRDLLDQEDELDREEFEEKMDVLQVEYDLKMESCWRHYKNIKAEAEAIKAEEERLAKRRKAKENRAEGLRWYVAGHLKEGAKWKSADGVAEFGWTTVQPSLEVFDEEAIPLDYVRTTFVPDKALIKERLKAGEEIPGVRLTEPRKTLVIK